MNLHEQIKEYIATQPEPKRSDLQALHGIILELMPDCKLWFLDGQNEQGRTVSNPNIGYGFRTIKYADGKTREFYQIGISANTTGISVYLLGIEDKKYWLFRVEWDYWQMLPADGHIRRSKTLDVTIQREQFPLKSGEPKYLAETYGKAIGKARVTGYCIKFKTLKDVNMAILKAAMQYGIEQTSI